MVVLTMGVDKECSTLAGAIAAPCCGNFIEVAAGAAQDEAREPNILLTDSVTWPGLPVSPLHGLSSTVLMPAGVSMDRLLCTPSASATASCRRSASLHRGHHLC